MITVIGAGLTIGQLTQNALNAIEKAKLIVVKTAKTLTSKYFIDFPNVIYLDDIYESASDFDSLNIEIFNRLLSLETEYKNICYVVSGDGVSDLSVKYLLEKHENNKIIAGVSGVSSILSSANISSNYQIGIFASDILSMRSFDLDRLATTIIMEIYNKQVAGELKLALLKIIPDEEQILLYVGENTVKNIQLCELDRQKKYDYKTSIVIKPRPLNSNDRFNFTDLIRIIYRLRDKDGCKWDRVQTHESIRYNAIEEAYELCEAVNLKDIDKMLEESGDVTLQGVFQAVIAEDMGEFDYHDMLTVLCQKLYTRHTHIFGNVIANNAEEALNAWEAAKAVEKQYETYTSRMDGIAKTLPQTTTAYKIQKIAAKVGFDWKNVNDIYTKINEELLELQNADEDFREGEAGDVLFAVVNLLRHYHIEPELALMATNEKFKKRFEYIENSASSSNKSLTDMSIEELETLWQEAKKCE